MKENYLDPYGITAFWLDACEPELKPGFQENLRYWTGPGPEVGNSYPREEVLTLNRSAWAGRSRPASTRPCPAPVLAAGATDRTAYLPAGARWTDAWTGEPYEGGAAVTVDAPLERIPLFLRDGAELPVAEQPLPAAGTPR